MSLDKWLVVQPTEDEAYIQALLRKYKWFRVGKPWMKDVLFFWGARDVKSVHVLFRLGARINPNRIIQLRKCIPMSLFDWLIQRLTQEEITEMWYTIRNQKRRMILLKHGGIFRDDPMAITIHNLMLLYTLHTDLAYVIKTFLY
jgi:hypothetical protein